MGTTVIGPVLNKYPAAATPALVYLKQNWSDDWTFVPELEFVEAAATTAAHGLGACTLLHRYGVLKNPWQSGSGPQQPASIDGCWVRIMLAGQQGMQQAWVGRISSETRTVYGSSQQSSGPTPAGQQRFQALAPLDILRKIDVSRSFWIINNEDPVALDWLAPLNEKYGRTDKPNATKGKALGAGPGAKALGSRSGNRSQNPDSNGVYAYGDYELWDYQQFAKYLLANFVDESATGGPAWTLGGQCDLLANYADPIEFGVTQTVEQILRRLVRPDYGLDYVIVPNDAGFEIHVFVLTKQSCGWGGFSLPGNPNTVKVFAGQTKDSVKTVVEKTSAQKYGTIRVLGGRIVCCGSFVTNLRLPNGSLFPGWPTTIGIEPSWNDQDQADYDAGTGNPADDASLQDEARRQERFNDVYRKFCASGFWYESLSVYRAPAWDGQGNPLLDENGIFANGAMQPRSRTTLPWIPLETGVDYSQTPPVDSNLAGVVPALRPPQIWLYDITEEKWVPSEKAHVGVSALHDNLGFFLHAHPNYLLAGANWQGVGGEQAPQWDCSLMVATLAFPTDQRIYCEQAIEGAAFSDGMLQIDASDCQLWFLAPNTMVDVDKNGQAVLSPPPTTDAAGLILRNDWQRMAARMAGALARHYQERARATITIEGLLPWGALLGQILTVIDEGGDTQTIEAAITEVHWTNGDNPTTVISTGFARE